LVIGHWSLVIGHLFDIWILSFGFAGLFCFYYLPPPVRSAKCACAVRERRVFAFGAIDELFGGKREMRSAVALGLLGASF